MKKILQLLKLQIDNTTDLFKTATPKTMLSSLFKVVFVLFAAIFVTSFAMGKIFVIGFKINTELLSLLLMVTQLISLAFAIGSVIKTLYLCRDNEMFVWLPVTPNQLFISKLLFIYLTELAINAMISIPLFVSLERLSYQGLGLSFYLSIPIMLVLMPVLPIILAAFLSIPLMWIIGFFKKHTALSVITIFSLIALCLWGYVSLIGMTAQSFDIANNQFETVNKVDALVLRVGSDLPIFYQMAQAMMDFSHWYFFVLFVLVFAIACLVTFVITRRVFFKLAMKNLEKTVKKGKREKKMRKSSHFTSLLLKEIRCVFRSTSDVFEYFLFTILMPFIVFSYDKLLMTITVNQAGNNMIAGAHVMVVAILAMLSNISSASAISRDGGNFYASKIIPVNYFTQIFAKFAFNALFTVGAIVVTAIISLIFLPFYPAWQIFFSSVAIAMAAIGHIAFCIDMDIKNPTVNLQGNESSSTVSKTTPKALASGLIIGFIIGIIVILMSTVQNQLLPYLAIIGLSFLFMVYRVCMLVLRINLAYDKIEM